MRKINWLLVALPLVDVLPVNLPSNKEVRLKNSDYAQVCQGTAALSKDGVQLIDEYAFGYRLGSIYLNSETLKNEIKVLKGATYTLGLLFDSTDFRALRSYMYPLSIAIVGHQMQAEFKFDSSFQYFTPLNYIFENKAILRTFNTTYRELFLTFAFPENDIIKKLDINYTDKDISFKRVQLSPGEYRDFPGFTEVIQPPCSLTDRIIEYDQYCELNLNERHKAAFVNSLRNGILGYDKRDGTYLRPQIIRDDLTFSTDDGDYKKLTLLVSNKDQSAVINFFVRCYDDVAPIIAVKENRQLRFPYYHSTEADILAALEIIDVSPIAKLYIEAYPSIIVHGSYQVNIVAIDSFSNRTALPITIKIYDDRKPVIKAPDYIQVSVNRQLSSENLLHFMSAFDEIEGDTAIEIDDSAYRGNAAIPGHYIITAKSQDKSGNATVKELKIVVKKESDISFVIYSNEIVTVIGQKIDLLRALNEMSISNAIPAGNYLSYSVIAGFNFDEETAEVGSYNATVSALRDDGTNYLLNLKIKVTEDLFDTRSDYSFWEKIAIFFQDLGTAIAMFFKNLFN